MGTTAAGWPYVEDGDFPLEFPVSSQALATKLQTMDTITTVTLTPVNGFVTGGTPVTISSNGFAAFISGEVQRTSGTSLTFLNAGAIPAAARPPAILAGPALSMNGSVIGPAFLLVVETDGSARFLCPTGQTPAWTSSTVIAFTAAWAV